MWLLVRRLTKFAAAARVCSMRLVFLLVIGAATPGVVGAQSADLLKAYQNFETAKGAGKVQDALKYGNDALQMTEASGDKHPLSKGLFDERLQKLGRKQDRVRPDGGRDTKQIRVWLGIRFRTLQDD